MMRLLIVQYLARRLDRIARDDVFMGRWHLALAVVAGVAVVGELGGLILHTYCFDRHKEAARGGRSAPCQH